MVGLMQIMIYLLCIYLVYKGVEIFQIAFMSSVANKGTKTTGVILGIVMIIGSIVVGVGAVYVADKQAQSISDNMKNVPKFP